MKWRRIGRNLMAEAEKEKIKKTPEELMALKEKARVLRKQREFKQGRKLGEISLAAKWCPTIDSSYDKTTLISLRKQVLVPLHKALELPEVYMSAKQWNVLPYKRVPQLPMKNYTQKFAKHDKERFSEYLRKDLGVCNGGNLSKEQMIRRVFVFSDMEFDQASAYSWETNYEAIQRKFREKGFTNVPEVVFWNLRASTVHSCCGQPEWCGIGEWVLQKKSADHVLWKMVAF
nr:uncharacterized protein LOC109185905 isoform X3 [Ipomoea batatas]